MTAELRVDEQQMKKKATELQDKVEYLFSLYQKLDDAVRDTKRYWRGEAADCHELLYQSCREEIEESLQELKKYPAYLLRITGNYEANEKEQMERIASLLTDVIV